MISGLSPAHEQPKHNLPVRYKETKTQVKFCVGHITPHTTPLQFPDHIDCTTSKPEITSFFSVGANLRN
jgi:hypothetical protein